MTTIEHQSFDQERAFYGRRDLLVRDCAFDGPADGESAFKECVAVRAERCLFNLRYPFWHDQGLEIDNCTLTPQCRAALWYSADIRLTHTALHGIKALRECADAELRHCDIASAEFGWFSRNVRMDKCAAESEYFMLRSEALRFREVRLHGKYAFQYIRDSRFDQCIFDSKDAFWHAKDVIVRNSTIRGEYLAWYSENVTFEHCKIIGTQPLCYCKNLRLVDCEMFDTDLAFERSTVEAQVTTPILSVKNPLSGCICAPSIGQVIRDIPEAKAVLHTGHTPCRCA